MQTDLAAERGQNRAVGDMPTLLLPEQDVVCSVLAVGVLPRHQSMTSPSYQERPR